MKGKNKYIVFIIFIIAIVVSLTISSICYDKVSKYRLIFSFDSDKLISINNLLITFSSITVGFIATLLGLILTIKDSSLLKRLDETSQYKNYIYYLRNNIYLGLLTVFTSLMLLIFMDIDKYIVNILNTSLIITVLILFLFNLIGVIKSTNIIIDLILNKDKRSAHNKGNHLNPKLNSDRD